MTREEFKKQVKRYFDSINPKRVEHTDDNPCRGILCIDCMFSHTCNDSCYPDELFEIMEEFQKWVKEHPVITNEEKFEQIFGIKVTPDDCPPASFGRCDRFIDCDGYSDCDKCKQWWNEEYKEPNGEVKE